MGTDVPLVGIAPRLAGLSSATLPAVLFTVSMGASGMAYLLAPEGQQGVQPR